MSFLVLSFLAGVVTVLAPCSFLFLPIILGGSTGSSQRYRPFIITASLGLSLFLFTILLKASSLLIDIDPAALQIFSGITITGLGIISLFPSLYDKISDKLGFSTSSSILLQKAEQKSGILGSILTGAALGPVFSSCSPTYVYILTTVLREDLTTGIINMIAYLSGLSLIMLAVGLLGQRFVKQLKFAVNPRGTFKRIISVLFILVGIAILTGLDKTIQSTLAPLSPVTRLEQYLLEQQTNTDSASNGKLLPPGKPAPEITGISEWINSDGESLQNLKGKVVLVDFWTYSCINCIRSAPYLNQWHDNYQEQGLVVLGIHAPEFAFEKRKENVQKAIDETYKIEYPVGLDNDFATWKAFDNKFWPAKYLIDANGDIRYTHFGEGKYTETEQAIRTLLQENGQTLNPEKTTAQDNQIPVSNQQTPETYLGWSRSQNFSNRRQIVYNQPGDYTLSTEKLEPNQWTIQGKWNIQNEYMECISDCQLKLRFSAKSVYIVAGNPQNSSGQTQVQITDTSNIDITQSVKGSDISSSGTLNVREQTLYKLVEADQFLQGELSLKPTTGDQLYAFTFGS